MIDMSAYSAIIECDNCFNSPFFDVILDRFHDEIGVPPYSWVILELSVVSEEKGDNTDYQGRHSDLAVLFRELDMRLVILSF